MVLSSEVALRILLGDISAHRVIIGHNQILAEVKQAFRTKSKLLHPDRETGCHERFCELQTAYEHVIGLRPECLITLVLHLRAEAQRAEAAPQVGQYVSYVSDWFFGWGAAK